MKKLILLIGLFLVLMSVNLAFAVQEDPRWGVFPVTSQECTDDFNPEAVRTDFEVSNSISWCTPSWECTEWSACRPDGKQIRSCEDKWDCGTLRDLPDLYQSCEYEGDVNELFVDTELFQNNPEVIVPGKLVTQESNLGNSITGAVVGGIASSKILLVLLGLFILGLYGLFVVGRITSKQ